LLKELLTNGASTKTKEVTLLVKGGKTMAMTAYGENILEDGENRDRTPKERA
jgi:hypothetical protein